MDKKRIVVFMLLYLVIFMTFAASYTQYIPYLSSLGYSELQKSIIQSSMALVNIIVQLILGYLSDKYRTIKKIMLITLVLFTVFAIFFYSINIPVFYLHWLTFVLYGAFYNSNFTMNDSWVLESGPTVRPWYSSIRAFGSIGWAIGSLLIPYFINQFGYAGAGYATLVFAGFTFILMLNLPDAEKHQKTEKTTITVDNLAELAQQPLYIIAVLSALFLYLINALNMIGVTDKMVQLGATATDIGLKWSIQAIVEIPIFFIGSWLLQKQAASRLMLISALTFTIQFVGFALSQSIQIILALSVLQMITYPLMILSVKNIIFDLSPEYLKTSGQSIAMSICSGFSSLIMPIYIAYMIKWFNHTIMVLSGSVFGLLAMFLIILLQKKEHDHGIKIS